MKCGPRNTLILLTRKPHHYCYFLFGMTLKALLNNFWGGGSFFLPQEPQSGPLREFPQDGGSPCLLLKTECSRSLQER